MEENICWGFKILYIQQTLMTQQQQKKTTQLKNEQRTRIYISLKKDIQMANKHIKSCSSLFIKEIQIKTTKIELFIPTRMALNKIMENNK